MVLDTYNYVMGHRFLRVMVLAFMIFSIIFCGVMVEYSHAIAWVIPAIEVVATILIACGVMSATDTDLEHVATAFYNSLGGNALSDVLAIVAGYESVGSGKFTFKATKAILSAVADWFAGQEWGQFDGSGSTMGNFTLPQLKKVSLFGLDFTSILCAFSAQVYFNSSNQQQWIMQNCYPAPIANHLLSFPLSL